MKILFLVAEFPKLSETFILNQIDHLRKKGHTVLVAALANPGETVIHPQAKEVLPQVVYPPFWAKKFLRPLYFVSRFGNKQLDIIHAHFGFAGKVGLTLKRFLHLPLVTSFYGIDASPLRFPKSFYRKLFCKGDLFLVLSEDMKKDLLQLGCPENKIRIHHVGVDLAEISKLKSQISKSASLASSGRAGSKFKTILSIGRLVKKKGFEDLIQAFKLVLDEVPQVKLKIIGGGPLEGSLRELVRKLGLEKQVKFLGPQPYKAALEELSQADVFALASHKTIEGDKEGTPVVLMEAQAMGVPVVSTRHAGIPEVVANEKTGLLVEERDINGLAKAIIRILKNPELGHRLGEEGRKHIEKNYNIKRQVEKLVEIYRELKS